MERKENGQWHYSCERNVQIVLALLKKHGIKRIIASPGTINLAVVASMMQDPWFEMYSCVDERSAAYMACGLAAETKEPVVLSCTGATASRNYIPALTEAFYRKLSVIALTSCKNRRMIGHLTQQIIDRTQQLNDMINLSVQIPLVDDNDSAWQATVDVNKALTECRRHGGGPVHINLEIRDLNRFQVKELPDVRMISHVSAYSETMPELPTGKILIYIGSHLAFDEETTKAIDRFCGNHDAAVLCEHTSGYKGKYAVKFALVGTQEYSVSPLSHVDLVIHLGEVAADCDYGSQIRGKETWRVSEDGEIRDLFRNLSCVFEMDAKTFFSHYAGDGDADKHSLADAYRKADSEMLDKLKATELPFSNIWIAMNTTMRIPEHSVIHFGILNSFRSWNFFELPNSVLGYCNAGGYGIDGCVSTMIGASLAHPDKLYFGVFGDLAFFYDMNSLGNHHIGKNIRIMIVNNGKGTEFRNYYHPWARFGDEADKYGAAGGHYGDKSPMLVKHVAEDMGFEYMTASTKDEYLANVEHWLDPKITDKPMLLEVFTSNEDESDALFALRHLVVDKKMELKKNVETVVRNLPEYDKIRTIGKMFLR